MNETKKDDPATADAQRAARELVKRVADNAAKRDDADGLEQLLLTSSRRSAELLAAAVHGLADRATGEELDEIVRDALDLDEQYEHQDAATTAKVALVRLGMTPLDAERVVELCSERVRGQVAGGCTIGAVQ